MQPSLLDPDLNLERVSALLHQAASLGVNLAVFPECTLTGYKLSKEESRVIAEPIPGPLTRQMIQICKEADIMAVVGAIDAAEDGRFYNTAMLIGPKGLLAKYHKTHVPFLGVDRFLSPGHELPQPIKSDVGRLGLMVCYDLFFPETTRVYALQGAQVILVPAAWMSSNNQYPEFVRCRAIENDVYVVGANWVGVERGVEYLGLSTIANSDGEIIAQASGKDEQIIIAEITPSQTNRGRRILIPGEFEMDLWNERRPDLYELIVATNSSSHE